jgi:glycerol dehydrogenase-like iron-containing ADH family enzyme
VTENTYSYIPGPAVYIQKKDAICEAGVNVSFLGKKALVLCDSLIQKKYYEALASALRDSCLEAESFTFSGECTYEESGRVYAAVKGKNYDFLIGFGGGKVLDTAKLAGVQLKLPWVLIATSAATCAAWTSVAIVYNADGTFRDIVDTGRAPAVTIVDETVVLEAPGELLVAGIGDSFAKYHEAKHVSAFKHVEKDELTNAALFVSAQMYEIIKSGKASKQELINANIAMSGYVSTAGRNATSALFAHAFANSILTVKGAKEKLHGYLAALGVVFEFVMLKKKFPDEKVYKRLGLPVSFSDIKLKPSAGDLQQMAELIKKDDSVEYFYPKIKKEALIKTLKKLL